MEKEINKVGVRLKSSKTFERDVWTVMGMPFDAVSQSGATEILLDDMAMGRRNFFTTPNLDFAIEGLVDEAFKGSVLDSDLVVPDGMPIVWVAKLLGIPLKERVAGSSVFDAIRETEQSKPLRVFLFGGPEGVAEQACKVLEKAQGNMLPAGFYYPGFGTVADMSSEALIQQINDSHCDFVLVALGAKKGQAWIEHNKRRLNAPVLSHLGAVVILWRDLSRAHHNGCSDRA
jgi:N-acetylglucosaminyldiphosphoundecaprenol N-acetyl-beta-D-mannosaminyltransferase